MKTLKPNISVLILLFINFLFCYKYSTRYTEFGIYLSGIVLMLQYLVFVFSSRFKLSAKAVNVAGCFLFFVISGLIVISHFKIPPESLNVDRWSVISSFWEELFDGKYPYYAESHLGNYPGPMPIYFIMALPFYLTGELSVLSGFGYSIIAAWFIFDKNDSRKNAEFILFLLFSSFFMVWEITTRSNIFTFSILIVLVLDLSLNMKNKSRSHFYGLAILTGLLLSTRSVYILACIIFFLSGLINQEISFKRLFQFGTIAFISFIMTFIPFICLFANDFFKMNPFIVQSSFLIPPLYTFLFMLISVVLSFRVKNDSDKFFYSGLSFFICILIYALYHFVNFGYEASMLNNSIDISYFIFSIPFFVKYLSMEQHFSQKKTSEKFV